MPVPDFQTLMKPLLVALSTGETSSAELRAIVARNLNLNKKQLDELLPSGRQTKFANRLAWANVFLQRAKLVERVSRGRYRISDRGRRVLVEDVERIDRKYLERFLEYREWREGSTAKKTQADSDGVQSTPEEIIEEGFVQIHSALEDDLVARLQVMSPRQFEYAILRVLVAMGYGGGQQAMAQATRYSNDEGIDGIINEDPLGLDQVFVQAKRYACSNKVGRPEIQAFVGSLVGRGTNKGIFVTTSSFLQSATEYTSRVPQSLILIDGKRLAQLMIEYNVGVRLRRTFELKAVDEDFFIDE